MEVRKTFELNLILHSYGEEHEYILTAVCIFLGLDIYACECAGERHNYALASAGTNTVDKITVIESDEHILALVLDLDLVVGTAYGGICRDRFFPRVSGSVL